MKSKTLNLALGLLAACAATLSGAQSPIASSSRAEGEGADVANAIVQALNADASLKDSKITVQPEKDYILLTGVAPSQQEMKKVTEIATAAAGGLQVVNVIQPEKNEYKQPEQELGKG